MLAATLVLLALVLGVVLSSWQARLMTICSPVALTVPSGTSHSVRAATSIRPAGRGVAVGTGVAMGVATW